MGMMLLPIELTEAERLLVLSDQSTKLTAYEALTEEKKAIPERMKALMGAINHLNHSIATNTVEREVEIREEPNTFGGTVRIFRVDTGAFVRERAMDPDERQLRLGDAAVDGGKSGSVTNLADHMKTEEQVAAGSPEEAEAMRGERLGAERTERMESVLAGLTVDVVDRGNGAFIARVEGAIPGLAGGDGLSGPIRETAEAARTDLLDEIRRLMQGSTTWDDVAAASAEKERLAEIDRLKAQQEADAAATKPKALLKAPKGAKRKKLDVQDDKGNPLPTPDETDTTPPPGLSF